jgi:ABC-type Na+ efflux pump permease subunit
MAYEAFNLVVDFFYGLFGHPVIAVTAFIGLLSIILLMYRTPAIVILIILIPITTGIVLTSSVIAFSMPGWVYILGFVFLAIIYGFYLWNAHRG